ncbi:MAG: AAA family ATPase [Wenzhouxiangella sp.]
MIKNLTFRNFYSFADEAIIDFALGKKPTPSGYDMTIDGERYNKAIAVVGANGSGKTQFLKPLSFLRWFTTESFLGAEPDRAMPFFPHRLRRDDSSHFELEFMLKGVDYRYQLELRRDAVIAEALYEKTSSQFSYLFKRQRTEHGYDFKQKGFHFLKTQAEKVRGNASLLAAAHSFDVAEARPFIDFFKHIESNIGTSGRHHFEYSDLFATAERFNDSAELFEKMSIAMSQFDLGLVDVNIREMTRLEESGKEEKVFLPFGLHKTSDGEIFELPFFEESSGTQSAFVLLGPILKTLQQGGIAVIDELDNDLHPHLVPLLLEWFEFDHSNPHQAQLIFTCHTPEVLNLLQKHQVYLVEKRDQVSNAWRLDDVTGLRADDNLYAKYMTGALGATPDL